MNIIADIAGRYDELILLLDKMPKGEKIVLLGDLNDRGLMSKEVIDWAVRNNIQSLKSNHGDMFIDAYNDAMAGKHLSENVYIFEYNGGLQTLMSYGGLYSDVPKEHIEYLKNNIPYIETEELILTHAPLNPNLSLREASVMDDFTWSRKKPSRRKQFQIHGHNTYFEEYIDNKGIFGLCLDDSGNGRLLGIHWPSKQIYSQEYL